MSAASTAQIRSLGRILTRSQLHAFWWALGIGFLITALGYFVPPFIEVVIGDKEISGTITFFGAPAVAVLITSFVTAIDNSGYTRVFISQGAARNAIAQANLLSLAIIWAIGVVLALVSFLLWNVIPKTERLTSLFGERFTVGNWIAVAGAFAVVLIFGALVATLFQRRHWSKGVATLIVLLVILPNVLAQFPETVSVLTWQGTPWIVAAILGGTYFWMIRGVEVK